MRLIIDLIFLQVNWSIFSNPAPVDSESGHEHASVVAPPQGSSSKKVRDGCCHGMDFRSGCSISWAVTLCDSSVAVMITQTGNDCYSLLLKMARSKWLINLIKKK